MQCSTMVVQERDQFFIKSNPNPVHIVSVPWRKMMVDTCSAVAILVACPYIRLRVCRRSIAATNRGQGFCTGWCASGRFTIRHTMLLSLYVCVCVCVFVREREREREKSFAGGELL